MITYTENKKLVTTRIKNDHNVSVSWLKAQAIKFNDIDNRFYKAEIEDVITKGIKTLTKESRIIEAKKRFSVLTNTEDQIECFDKENNNGYKLCLYYDEPVIFSYSMVYPIITEFFKYWEMSKNCETNAQYDLSKLFEGMENFKELEYIFKFEHGENLKNVLYNEFPEFAIFYYEIYPKINLEVIKSYNIVQIVNTKIQMCELGLDTTEIDELLSDVSMAQRNDQVLKLIRSKNKNNSIK